MTTQTQPKPAVQAPPARKSSGSKIATIVVGGLLALAGAGAAVGGGGLLAVFGGDGTVDSGRHSLSTSSTALVSEVADIDDTDDVSDVVGKPRVRLSVHATGSTEGLFVGIGPAKQVDRYLASAPIDEVSDLQVGPFDSFELTHNPRSGSKLPARPASQPFWVAKGTGTDAATLRWKLRDGDYRVVVMNADGSRGVHTDGDVGVTVPHLPAIGWSLLGGGLALLAGGIGAIVLGARRR
jgi:hypothetical protein